MRRVMWNFVPFIGGAGLAEKLISGSYFDAGIILFAFAAFQIGDLIGCA